MPNLLLQGRQVKQRRFVAHQEHHPHNNAEVDLSMNIVRPAKQKICLFQSSSNHIILLFLLKSNRYHISWQKFIWQWQKLHIWNRKEFQENINWRGERQRSNNGTSLSHLTNTTLKNYQTLYSTAKTLHQSRKQIKRANNKFLII